MKNFEEPRFIQRQRNRAERERRSQQDAEQLAESVEEMDRISQQNAAEQKAEKRQKIVKETREWFTLAFLILTAGATITQAFLSRRQTFIAEDTEKRQLRAYVFFGAFTPDSNEFHSLQVSNTWVMGNFKIRNVGATPAYGVRLRYSVAVRAAPQIIGQSGFEISAPPDMPLPTTIPPLEVVWPGADGNIKQEIIYNTKDASELSDISSGKSRLFIVGSLEYIDAFQQPHHSDFCMFTDVIPSANLGNAILTVGCASGHDSD